MYVRVVTEHLVAAMASETVCCRRNSWSRTLCRLWSRTLCRTLARVTRLSVEGTLPTEEQTHGNKLIYANAPKNRVIWSYDNPIS